MSVPGADSPSVARRPSFSSMLLAPNERITLEAIRDMGMVSRERCAWAKEKGYAEPMSAYRYQLTREGFEALLSDAAGRRHEP